MFLGQDKLKSIEESREINIPTETPASIRKQEVGRLCPSCKASIKKGKIRTTIINVCEKCFGIWLDKGELESIQLDYEMCKKNIASNRSKKSNNSLNQRHLSVPSVIIHSQNHRNVSNVGSSLLSM